MRARTDRPGALVHRAATLRSPSDRHLRAALKELFLLDPDVTYLNHGSFGACPRPVFEVYQRRQRELERQPVDFIMRKLPGLLAEARAALGEYLGADADDLTFVTNAGTGIN